MAQIYNKEGYIVLKNIFTEEEIDKVISEVHEKGFNPDYTIIKTRDANRCQDLWENSESVKNLSTKPEILSTLEMLYGREAVPFQTLNFLCGTQQMAHSDTIHFSSLPAKFMAGVWIALDRLYA